MPEPHKRSPGPPALRRKQLLCALAALALCCCLAGQARADLPLGPRVLVLHSYHQGYAWTDSIQAGIVKTLAAQLPDADVCVEYMDSQRQPPGRIFPLLQAYLAGKYAGHPPAVILASDDNALDFLLANRDTLFPGAPVFFCGVNDLESKNIHKRTGFSGIVETSDMRGTIDVALRLMPGLRRLALVTSATETGEAWCRQYREVMEGFRGRLEPLELCGLPFAELSARLTTLSPDTAILYMGLQRDPTGLTMTVDESLEFIRRATAQPVFVLWDFALGKGTVGGIVVSGRRQGEAIAAMAARYLHGEGMDALPLLRVQPLAGMFDAAEMERLGLPLSKLPEGSVVLNRRPGFFERYGGHLAAAGMVALLMAVVVLLQARALGRLRRAEAKHAEASRRFRALVESLSVAVLELSPQGEILFANRAAHVLTDSDPGSLPGTSALELADDDDRDDLRRRLTAALPPGSSLVRLKTRQGRTAEVMLDWIRLAGPDGRIAGYLAAATDLTELRHTERELSRQHRITMAVLDATPTPVAAMDMNGRYVLINRAMCLFCGQTAEDLLGKRARDLPEEALSPALARIDAQLMESSDLPGTELILPNALGSQRSVIFSRTVYHDEDGRPQGVVCSLVDITSRKSTEAALAESREKYRTLFEHLPLAVCVTDADGRLLEINQSMERLLGLPRARVLLRRPEERAALMNNLDGTPLKLEEYPSIQAIHTRLPVRRELLLRRPDGDASCVQCTAAPLGLPGYGALLALADITERRRMEQIIKSRLAAVTSPDMDEGPLNFNDLFELKDTQAVQDAFAAAMGVGLVLTSPEGAPITRPSGFGSDCAVRICSATGDACSMLGLSDELLLEAGVQAATVPILAGDATIAYWRMLQRLNSSEPDPSGLLGNCRGELPLAAAPERFPLARQALTLMAGNLSELALKILQQARSIESQRRTETELQQAKELAESASKAKSDFLANMSHEIRTPLHGVLGMLQLMQGTPPGKDQDEYLDKALYSARSLLSIINDILDFSKIESGTLELAQETFDPAALVRVSAALFREQAEAKGLALELVMEQGLPKTVRGDAGKMRQMLFNLIGNAVKFTDQGRIGVRLAALNQTDGHVVLFIDVEDTGVGIPEDLQSVIFEPFIQGENVFTKRFQGTGLGLAIVRRLAGLMDGGISVESTPGKGTRFSLALRLTRARKKPVRRDASADQSPNALPPLRLLLAEDNIIGQLAAKSFLTRAGHEVVTAQNGQEALDALESQRFDAVLMDIQMPVMDGVEATRRIRAHDGTRFDPGIPVIALTAYAQAGEHKAFLDAGMDEAIAKPLEPADIIAALSRAMERQGGPQSGS